MPTDPFDVLMTAERVFGGMPTAFLVLATLGMIAAGIWVTVSGLRVAPASWGLLAAGLALLVSTYFVAGAAIASGVPSLATPGPVSAGRAATICFIAAVVPAGLAFYAFRVAARWLFGSTVGERVGAVLLGVLACAMLFASFRIAAAGNRYRLGPAPEAAESPDEDTAG